MLLHGFPEFWWTWRHQMTALAALGFRAVAVDLRGYGDSDKPPRGYDLWTLAGDIAGLVGALGESRADLVGHDWGGLIAWTVAALHPRRVRTLAAIAAPHPLALRRAPLHDLHGLRHALGFQLPRWPERSLRADDGARVERVMRAWSGAEWAASDDFAGAVARYRRAIQVPGTVHCAMEYFRWALRSQLRAEGRRFAAAVARPAEVPVLQLHGADDPCLPARTVAASRPWAGPDHRPHVLPSTGHFPQEELPQVVTDLLAEHLGAR